MAVLGLLQRIIQSSVDRGWIVSRWLLLRAPRLGVFHKAHGKSTVSRGSNVGLSCCTYVESGRGVAVERSGSRGVGEGGEQGPEDGKPLLKCSKWP